LLEPGSIVTVTGMTAHYLGRVLRAAVGDAVTLFNGDGFDYTAELVRFGKGEAVMSLVSREAANRESGLRITVVQAISRGERMDQTLQKCTELGAAAFQPIDSERVEVKLKGDKLEKRLAHWQGVVVSACEQSGRAVIPEVLPPLGLADWLSAAENACRLVLAPGADEPLARAAISDRVEIVVGPEGGFSDSEMFLMASKNVLAVSMGPRVLRTETAAPAAVAVLQAVAGDFA